MLFRSPANIAVGAARLGLNVGMITRVGDEHMGRFVRETLAAEGVDVSQVRTDPQRLTGLVILGIRDRESFPLIFYRENCADMALAPADMDAAFIAQARAIVVTGTHFSTPGVDAASRTAIGHARAAGTKVVLDIDYRPVLWGLTGRGLGEQRFVASANVSAHLQTIVPHCDLIVGTEEEFHIAGGTVDTVAALRRLRELTPAVFALKRGAQGCAFFTGVIPPRLDDGLNCPGFPVEVFNVLGAGDAFLAGLLRGWLRGEPWERAARIANACGALVVSQHGYAPAMPSWTEIEDFLSRADGVTRLHDDPPPAARLLHVATCYCTAVTDTNATLTGWHPCCADNAIGQPSYDDRTPADRTRSAGDAGGRGNSASGPDNSARVPGSHDHRARRACHPAPQGRQETPLPLAAGANPASHRLPHPLEHRRFRAHRDAGLMAVARARRRRVRRLQPWQLAGDARYAGCLPPRDGARVPRPGSVPVDDRGLHVGRREELALHRRAGARR